MRAGFDVVEFVQTGLGTERPAGRVDSPERAVCQRDCCRMAQACGDKLAITPVEREAEDSPSLPVRAAKITWRAGSDIKPVIRPKRRAAGPEACAGGQIVDEYIQLAVPPAIEMRPARDIQRA